MPVNTAHPSYTAMAPVWRMCRDVAGGQRTIHGGGVLYLPKLAGETAKDYEARKARALFFNASWRTIAGLSGMLMRKAPTVKVSKAAEAMLEDVTQSGVSLENLARAVAVECLTVGRNGLMVDYPKDTAPDLTVAQVEALNLRPKMVSYTAEAIINWEERWVRNKSVVSSVRLKETASVPDPKDEFKATSEERWRVLDLAAPTVPEGDKAPEDWPELAYRVRVFKLKAGKKGVADTDFELVEGPFFPLLDGKPLPFVPFVFIGVDNTRPDVEEPPLVDLFYANVSHYQSTADVEHGAHKTALPQPWVAGIDGSPPADSPGGYKKPTFYMGGSDIWMHPLVEGTFGMLEYNGTGLDAIEKRLERKEKHMAVLGARMLEDQKKEAETAEVAGMHRSGEQATLASQGKTCSAGIRQALEWFDLWAGGTGENVEFALNDEFMPANMTPEQLTALVQAWQNGALSPQDLFAKLQKGGVVADEQTFETQQTQIENAPPRLTGGPDNGNDTAPGGQA